MSLARAIIDIQAKAVGALRQGKTARVLPAMMMAWLILSTLAALTMGLEFVHKSESWPIFRAFMSFFLPVWCLLWVLFAISWWREKGEIRGIAGRSLLLIPITCFLVCSLVPPVFSDDINRYVWEGRVIINGFNPFSSPPNAQELQFLQMEDPELYHGINYPEISAIYPPLAQGFFALLAMAGAGIYTMKVFFAMLYVCVFLPLTRMWMINREIPASRFYLLLYHPLPFLEVAVSGHLDVLLMIGATTAFFFVSAGREMRNAWGAAGGLAIAVLSKVAPIALIPHLAIQWKSWRGRAIVTVAVPALAILAYLPFASAGGNLFSAMGTYNRVWAHNAGGFYLIESMLDSFSDTGDWFSAAVENTAGKSTAEKLFNAGQFGSVDPNLVAGRFVAAGIFGIIWLILLIRRLSFEQQWFWIVSTGLLLSPVVHPWYLLSLVPLIIFSRTNAFLAGWWTLTIPFTYLLLPRWWMEGVWEQPAWTWWLQYGGLAAIGAALILWRSLVRDDAEIDKRDSSRARK